MTKMAARSYVACRRGLEQPQGGADFWQAFSGEGFGIGGVTPPESGMEPLAGDPQHFPLFFGLESIFPNVSDLSWVITTQGAH